jgi:hypothetical protein
MFIDKPVAASLADIVRIFDWLAKTGTPCFSNSSLRYSPGIAGMRDDPRVGRVLGCDAYSSNAPLEPSPRLVLLRHSRLRTAVHDHGAGLPNGDARQDAHRRPGGRRLGGRPAGHVPRDLTGHGRALARPCSATRASRRRRVRRLSAPAGRNRQLLPTGQPPFSAEQTLEIYAFMEAADESKRQGGVPVSLDSVLRNARQTASQRK